MSRSLLLYEDGNWRSLRPLTEVVPVPALAFGDSSLAGRWRRVTNLPLLSIEARAGVLSAWESAPPLDPLRPDGADDVLVINAAALPGRWLDAALETGPPTVFRHAGRVLGARLNFARVRPGISRGAEFEAFLLGLELPESRVEARVLTFPWNLIEWNAEWIAQDLADQAPAVRGEVHRLAAVLEPEHVTIEAGARVDPYAVLDARPGPIRIGADVVVASHTVVTGPCVVGAGTQLLGGSVGRSTIGPQCRIAGEVEECLWQGFSNKRHHGFIGHSVIGEWVNLGALTTSSDLKNNYGTVRVWVDGREIDSGSTKVGSLIGAHVKTGIGTLLPTGGSMGTGSNLFGGGRFAPRHVPPFSWWDGERFEEHRLEAFLRTARTAMGRRGRSLASSGEEALEKLFDATAQERRSAATQRVGA